MKRTSQLGSLGAPTGSLEVKTAELLGKVGFLWKIFGRKFKVRLKSNPFLRQLIFLRPQEIPGQVKSGELDIGICGWDCVVEAGLEKELRVVVELPFARKSKSPARVALFGKQKKFIDEKRIKVKTEYRYAADLIFTKAQKEFSYGGTEALVAYCGYDYGIGVVESGQSIKDNNLVIVRELFVSPVVLIAKADLSPEKTRQVGLLGKMLQGAFLAEEKKLLKFNILNPADLPRIEAEKFWLERLTLSQLDGGGLAAEALIRKSEVVKIIARLSGIGASGIIVQAVDFFLPSVP
ncbi:MAG: hypothetical protein PHE24_04115 [Patescibacteria group bacterium]|nr:hypothetical protein [Patescibacteria group bacterium]